MNRSLALLSVLAAAVITSTACTDSRDGRAQPKPTTEVSTSPGTSAENTGSNEAASLAVEPCALIEPERDLTDYGQFTGPESKKIGHARTCFWRLDNTNLLDEALSVGLAVRDTQSVETVNDVGGGVTSGEVNGRPAAEAPNPQFDDCTLALKLDDRSRIDINITLMDDVNDACQVARDIAYLIEPRLPALRS